MKMTADDVLKIKSAIAIARIAGIDAIVITNNIVAGLLPSTKLALISTMKFSFDPALKIGIGRIAELEKRLSIFGSTELEIEGKGTDAGEISVLNISAGKSKVQFRCTSERMIKYPKGNDDPAIAVVTGTKAEIQQIARAAKTLGAETITLAIGRTAAVKFECSSPTNEMFSTELAAAAVFENDQQAIVHIYEADRLAAVLDAAVRDADELSIVVGEFGSLTIAIKGHTLIAMPEANMESDDE